MLKKICCSDLETLFINCKSFYSPQEFCSFILVSVYNPPQAHVSSALQKLADLITVTEQQYPDSVLIISGTLIKQISPVNCQNTDSTSHVPPETVIYWTTTNHGSLQNSDSSIRPKKMLTERGIKSCINRPNTHWKRRSEWQRGIFLAS